ncbi:TIGR03905 family TSCPD domain-containing protein [Citrifermentans bremense]|uniref:TIGR03905 family TSCPD domain-containing protein n=1 Tax=Citrifermentans bremense TaxID=60035 RepID=UPI0004174BF0|nr:TIGR03905 family TSCPD domain-containing protein [Citrifermentans bremense]
MKISYQTSGSCASRIEIEVDNGVIVETTFVDGCAGNTQAVSALVRGMEVSEAIRRLKGIACQGDTSCPDQLAQALEKAQSGAIPS